MKSKRILHTLASLTLLAMMAACAPEDGGNLALKIYMPPSAHSDLRTNPPNTGGSAPSDVLDMFGIANDNPNLRYARIRLLTGRD